jgi:type VI protein secretion system component VasF
MTVGRIPQFPLRYPEQSTPKRSPETIPALPVDDSAEVNKTVRKAALAQLRTRLQTLATALKQARTATEKTKLRQRIVREILRAELPSASINYPDMTSVLEDVERFLQSNPELNQKFEAFLIHVRSDGL